MTSHFPFERTTDSGTFTRYIPFGDGRVVIVRRGKELGFKYGVKLSRREVEIDGHRFPVVRFGSQLSPPAHRPGAPQLSPEALAHYRPQSEVLSLPDAEVLFPRAPTGFSDEEVDRILRAIQLA